ncbi:hypothetical protein CDAR_211931 [Caerostris darwini]|uniref:Uncharacterized protein n=1 Tax=Caerostris darwini TaxID=1538125 RepID=A0AAV4PCN4_9ARAC|nr:hypothetical protein CDAR_211931 [Caerostris darwini]
MPTSGNFMTEPSRLAACKCRQTKKLLMAYNATPKMAKKKDEKKKEGGKKKKEKAQLVIRPPPDPLDESAMENGYYMSSNAAIFLKHRGIPWPFDKPAKSSKTKG